MFRGENNLSRNKLDRLKKENKIRYLSFPRFLESSATLSHTRKRSYLTRLIDDVSFSDEDLESLWKRVVNATIMKFLNWVNITAENLFVDSEYGPRLEPVSTPSEFQTEDRSD